MKRTLFIDGSNLYGGLTDVLKPGQYISFGDLLKEIEKDLEIHEVRFYGSYMRVDSAKPAVYQLITRAQKAFFDSAKAEKKVIFYKGHFSGAGKEKGIDVHLAVDMAVGACTDAFDEAILMTGDADLSYGLEVAKQFGKSVHLMAFGSRFPYGLSFKADKKFVYDYDHFFSKKVRSTFKKKPPSLQLRDLKSKVKVFDA